MLWAVTSSERCWASRPRSAVLRPPKALTDTSGLQVQDAAHGPDAARPRRGVQGRAHRGARLAGRLVADVLAVDAHHARQVREEGQLLTHERPVDGVLALDLREQAA